MAASDDRPTRDVTQRPSARAPEATEAFAVVIVWAREEPERLGEVGLVTGRRVVGRGDARAEDPARRLEWVRQRPGAIEARPPLTSTGVSRIHLTLEPTGAGLKVRALGRRPVRVAGVAVDEAGGLAAAGATIELDGELLLLVTRRAPVWPATGVPAGFGFGAADAHELVGESPAVWAVRAAAAFAARVPAHVLVHGPSGAGKELVARAIHAGSARAARPLVARNAATLPEGLIDAELFGNIRGYPNPGMPERRGLVGEADGSSLLLDEIGELPATAQAHLLRLLDRDGEYQRLGDPTRRRADLRVIAATNRDPAELKHDLAARLGVRVAVPGLDARREDVPLLVQHALAIAARDHGELVARFRGAGGFRVSAELMAALVTHPYTTHVRELDRLVWQAVAESPGDIVALGPATRAALAAARAVVEARRPAAADVREPDARDGDGDGDSPTEDPGADAIRAALAAARGSVTRAATALGLRNRYVLYRLLKKHGIEA